jgi:phage shock protein PspC (stress-responsive transcriptional regulator)
MGDNPDPYPDTLRVERGSSPMVTGRAGVDDPAMTTEQPTAPRLLRRRSDDRVIGGVASGLGDYFNVDPLLIRIGFVGLMVFGGMGILLYAAAWLLVPDEATEQSIAQRIAGRAGIGGGFLAAVLIVVGAIMLLNVLGDVARDSEAVPAVVFALLVILAGVAILRRGEPDAVAPAAETPAAAVESTTAAPPPRVVVRRPPRPRSPLGWYVMGAMLVGVGLLAVVATLLDAELPPGHYVGLALGVLGIGLIVGTWWGSARALILLGVLLVPAAYAASLIDVPIEGGWGSQAFSPTTVQELRGEYRLVGGELILDLTQIDGAGEPIEIAASVAMGQIFVLLPDDAGLELDAAVGGGTMLVLGAHREGTDIEERYVIDGEGPQFALDLEAGLGEVRVETLQAEDR